MIATGHKKRISIGYAPQIFCALSILLSIFDIFVLPDLTLATTTDDTARYATSFFSLTDPNQVEQVNLELSKILRTHPSIKIFNVTCIPVTSKGKRYFRSVVVTDQKGLHALKKVEHEIGGLLARKVMGQYGLAVHVKRWAYRLEPPISQRKPKVIPLYHYDKIDMPTDADNRKRFVVLIRKFDSLFEANRFCRRLGAKGIEAILGYPRKITSGRDGRKIDAAPYRVFLKNLEGTNLLFRSVSEGDEYVRKNKIPLQEKAGAGLWEICDAASIWQLVPQRKDDFLLGSFRLDQLRSKKEQIKQYLDALEERGIPFYLTTVSVGKHTYLRVVHVVADELQTQIDMALGRLTEELNDFSIELGKDFNIHPQKIPRDDPIEGARFTLDDLLVSISSGTYGFLEENIVGQQQKGAYEGDNEVRLFSLTSRMNGVNGLPVGVRDLFKELFLPRTHPLQNDLKGKNMIGLKVIKTFLPGKGEYTCFAIEENYQAEHMPLAEKLKGTGKILTFFVYRQQDRADLDRLAQFAAQDEIRRRQAETMDIARIEKDKAKKRLALEAAEMMARRQKFAHIQYIIDNFSYSPHIQPVILYEDTLHNFSFIDETINSIDLTDCPDLPSTIKALMWAESSGNPRAISDKNAQGALQVTLQGYLHTRRKFAELIRMAETEEMVGKDGHLSQAQEILPLASRRLLENAWRLVDPRTDYKEAAQDPKLNICEGTLQFLIDYTFFCQRYIEEKPKGGRSLYYPYRLKIREKDYYPDEDGVLDAEIAAMASYNYGRYGVIKAIKRKGKNFMQALPRQTRQHLANYFITKLSLDERYLAEYKACTNHDITVKPPRKPYRFRGKIRFSTLR
jgi:hypothetical protein